MQNPEKSKQILTKLNDIHFLLDDQNYLTPKKQQSIKRCLQSIRCNLKN